MADTVPNDLLTYEQASDEFHITIAQIRYLIKKGSVVRYKRGQLRGSYVSRAEIAAAVAIQPAPLSDDSPDEDE